MTAAPLTPRHRADRHCDSEAVALVVRSAANLCRADQWPDMLGPHLHVGFEAAASKNDRVGWNGLEAFVVAYFDAFHAPIIVQQKLDHGAAIADLNAHLLRRGKPTARQPDPLMLRTHDHAARPDHNVAFFDGGY